MAAMDGDGIVGCADGVKDGKIEGWAWRPQAPEDHVVVQVLADDALLGEWTACLHRPDLEAAGIGDGRHAFEIPLDLPVSARSIAHVIVRAKGGATLPNGVFDVPCGTLAGQEAARAALLAQLEMVFGPLADGLEAAPDTPAPAGRGFQLVLYGGSAQPGSAGAQLRDAFAALLRPVVALHVVRDVAEADGLHADAAAAGEICVMLSFAPVHETPLAQRFPVVPVIAWPFATLPDGAWSDDPREDWRFVLRQTGRAIATSAFAARVVRAGVGAWYPVAFIPVPAVDRPLPAPGALRVAGIVWDSREAAIGAGDRTPTLPAGAIPVPSVTPGMEAGGDEAAAPLVKGAPTLLRRFWPGRRVGKSVEVLPAAPSGVTRVEASPDIAVALDGVVFTAMVSARDTSSRWQDLVLAFATAFVAEPAATLVLRMVAGDPALWWWELHGLARSLPEFACRILVLHGGMDTAAEAALIGATRFVVSADAGEATGAALMPFLAAGRPGIVPAHTAWLDYVSAESGFVVACEPALCAWPRDPRRRLATLSYRVDFMALCDAFRAALRTAHDPVRMAAMADAASAVVRAQAADGVVAARLAAFLGLGEAWVRRAGWAPIRGPQPEAMP
jgi:hypothetical protein